MDTCSVKKLHLQYVEFTPFQTFLNAKVGASNVNYLHVFTELFHKVFPHSSE